MGHCVVDYGRQPAALLCQRCGGEAPLPLPLQISQMVALINKFEEEHKACRAKDPQGDLP